jgi:hypothetical protein
MRTVVKSNEVFHLWVHEAQSNARGAASISFHGPDAYSYGAVIGRIVRNAAGEKAFLVATRSYSITTSRHQGMLRRAIPSDARKFFAREINHPNIMLAELVDSIPGLAAKAKRARQNKEWRLREVQGAIETARGLAEFFGLPVPAVCESDDLDSQIEAALADHKRREELEAVRRREVQERQKAEYFARYEPVMRKWAERTGEPAITAEDSAEHMIAAVNAQTAHENEEAARGVLAAWLRGDSLDYSAQSKLRYLPGHYMRVEGREVVTTTGARVPLAHVQRAAPAVLRMIDAAKQSGEPFYPPSTLRLGHYTLSAVTPDGTVMVGCHKFQESEIRRFADVISGLPVEAEESRELEAAV